MREIKFRAWSSNTNEMKVAKTICLRDDGGITVYSDSWLAFDEHLHLMQFTGLKDKNGKEIYEGDVLHLMDNSRDPLWGTNEKHPVVFDGGAFRIDTMNIYELLGWGGYPKPLTLEVIGNIYENPELLNN